MKFLFGTEAYWVKNRYEKDKSNCHIYLAAKTEIGRQAINDILSEANITGFYGRPRIDTELILSLPPNDVIVTTACLAFWKYDGVEDFVEQLQQKFKDNFFLEVQYHNTDSQRELNKKILAIHNRLKVPLIFGCDSHYIRQKDDQLRTDFLTSKEIKYPEETGWYLDYPDGDIAYQRFAEQCVLNDGQINDAIDNTNIFLEVEEYDNPCFNKEIKCPTLYPHLSQDEKNKEYESLVWANWEKYRVSIPKEQWGHYETEIAKEIDCVKRTNTADYFLDDYYIVKKGIENGGVITTTGRGSGVSFITNMLLGFTDVDRIASSIKMYPERFMSATRILEAKTLPDLDLNLGTVAPFAQAQKEILGEEHAYPMIAYGVSQKSSSWKLYAKSQGVPFDIANKISEQLRKYEKALRHVEEDAADNIDVLNYIDKEYHEIYNQSKKYQGTITSWSIAPCSYLLYQGDIRKEIGLIKIKDNLCCLMDGKWAEEYKFLKNDLLKVSIVDMIDRIYKRIGIPKHTVKQLLSLCTPDDIAWSIYKKGCTLGINQVEQPGTANRVSKYAPTNISELCAFVAAIRPGFKSMYKIFEDRKHFEYGIKSLDELIQTPEMPHSFILYQEMSMSVLHYAGIPMSECYEIIKNIAKKRVEKVLQYKEQFLLGFKKALMDREGQTEGKAAILSDKVWKILEDSSQYSFNASHSYCVAIDSLYSAYLKAHYPLQFYEVYLTIQEEKGDKDKMNAAKEEAESFFGIKFPPFRFGQDNRTITADPSHNAINNSLASIKGFGTLPGEVLYKVSKRNFEFFTDVLLELDKNKLKSSKIEPLIKIDYFSHFGNSRSLLLVLKMFDFFKQGNIKSLKKEKITSDWLREIVALYAIGQNSSGKELKSYSITDPIGLLHECERQIMALNVKDYPYIQKIQFQSEILGYVNFVTNKKSDERKLFVNDVIALKSKQGSKEIWGYALFAKNIGNGESVRYTLKKSVFDKKPVKPQELILEKFSHINKTGWKYLDSYDLIR